MKTLLVLMVGILAACGPRPVKTVSPEAGPWTAKVSPTPGNKAAGELTVTRLNGEIQIMGEVHGLSPKAEHGIHIHEFGDCSGANAEGAGAHFNPTSMTHGGAHGDPRHSGDLGNLKTDALGVAIVDIRVPMPADARVEGRSIVVHAKPDDFSTQPSGNSGARVGCGVIGR